MKTSACVLAFFLSLTSTAGFTVQPQKSIQTHLKSFSYGNGQTSGYPTELKSTNGANTMTGAGSKVNTQAPYRAAPAGAKAEGMQLLKNIMDSSAAVTVQGGALRTYSFESSHAERAQLILKTEGRPLNANVELWHGPDNTPQKMSIYSEDGNLRPFRAIVETPRSNNAVAIRNTGHLEFPLAAWVEPDENNKDAGFGAVISKLSQSKSRPETIQGGALKTYPFEGNVASVQILLSTDGRPLNARVELLQGPNNNKQVMEIYTEDGTERPFFCVIETPGSGNVVRVVNTATVEFPLYVNVGPYLTQERGPESGNRGWDNGGANNSLGNRGW